MILTFWTESPLNRGYTTDGTLSYRIPDDKGIKLFNSTCTTEELNFRIDMAGLDAELVAKRYIRYLLTNEETKNNPYTQKDIENILYTIAHAKQNHYIFSMRLIDNFWYKK